MYNTIQRICAFGLAVAALALSGCSFPNAAVPGPSAVAFDNTGNQVWLVSSGKLYRCSVSGSSVACTQMAVNTPP
jgi:hypothetical protein